MPEEKQGSSGEPSDNHRYPTADHKDAITIKLSDDLNTQEQVLSSRKQTHTH